jgi:KDO2-lipid IV(A) lauroyltransferase
MYYLFLLGKFLALILPRNVCYYISFFFAKLKFYFSKRDREVLIFNLLPVVKDEKKAIRCTERVFRNFGYYLVDFFRFSKLDMNFIKKYVKIEGLHFLRDLVLAGKRIIAFTAHLGNYELGAAITSMLGYKVYGVALPHKDTRLNNFFNNQRKLCGVGVIQTGMGIRRCFKCIEENKIVALLGDRDYSCKGKRTKLFGKTCLLPRGTAMLSLRTQAYILPSFLIREGLGYYKLIFDKPISPFNNGLKKTEDQILEECASILEKYIWRYPEQWYIFEKYWID